MLSDTSPEPPLCIVMGVIEYELTKNDLPLTVKGDVCTDVSFCYSGNYHTKDSYTLSAAA